MKDSWGRTIEYLRLSVTDLCNLRCAYCMGPEGVCKKQHAEILTEEEMLLAVEAAVACGVRKVRITGGEPLVKPNILSICSHIARIAGVKELCLTTNGTLLAGQAQALQEAGVQRINISLDTLQQEKYIQITGHDQLAAAMEGIHAALAAGFEQIKINTVLIGGFNDDEIPALADLTVQYPVDLRFIELMPMNQGAPFGKEAYCSAELVKAQLPSLSNTYEVEGVARLYRLPHSKGRVGLITPVTAHFCDECNRIRITADGHVKPCLHSGLEYSLKGCTKEEMIGVMREAIMAKPARHGRLSYDAFSPANRQMNRIGG